MFANDGSASGTAVALLARPGQARERLREALHQVGASIVLEDDPTAIDAQTLVDAAPDAVLIALEPAIEDAVERLDSALDLPGLTVIFDEAELAARREGWEAQRWARHLAAKLQGHQDVLPPGRETDTGLQPDPGLPATPAQLHAGAPIGFHVEEAASVATTVPGDSFYAWQPPADVAPGFEDLQFASAEAAAAAGEAAAMPPLAMPAQAPAASAAPASTPPPLPASAWSLVDDDAPLLVQARAPLSQMQISTEGLSLVALESEQESAIDNPAAAAAAKVAQGAVLVMAGIGGPDAIRRLLAALPADFPQPLLVQLRLDGGRYGNLVKQIARVSALPVLLAEAGQTVGVGNVYILPDDIGVRSGDTAGLRFVVQQAGASVVGGLPAAHSAVLLLSGSDPHQVEDVLALAAQGAWVAGQTGDGCYDPAAAAQLIGRGHPGGDPVQLAQALSARWGG
ncbi:chemotaxis-related protein [Xanthomonas translucens pv. poae]|uniref:protein-glutamate methylesterase n=2 Tax=Xanthomonas translucens group TaxID=3390202 RepID=A0A0K3A6W2_9XANT|nr:chemotaxis protein CheB [Xanthomonas translucens]UKE63067.1 chemotaxis protein [Xanthomonas translucens pv. poae]CTP92234.1 chemotaxis-related protein [Xanthomonas translucens pv. poae]